MYVFSDHSFFYHVQKNQVLKIVMDCFVARNEMNRC